MSGFGYILSGSQAMTSDDNSQWSRNRQFILTAVNVNSALTDVGTFTGLPSKYRVDELVCFDASTSLTLATVDLRTAAAGAGTAIVSAAALAAATAATKLAPCTLAVTSDYQTASSLVLRNVTAQGAAATASFLLRITVLS